jgi:hypothetical protein
LATTYDATVATATFVVREPGSLPLRRTRTQASRLHLATSDTLTQPAMDVRR